MGTSYYVYIGPYLEVHNPPRPTRDEFQGCSNRKCRSYHHRSSAKFCSDCGGVIGLVSKPTTEQIDFDCYEECDERLTEQFREERPEKKKDYSYFVPNQGKIGRNFSAYDTELAEINSTIISEELHHFKVKFEKDVNRLKEVFGADAVALKWGVMAYAA